jgi:hypothetical protein
MGSLNDVVLHPDADDERFRMLRQDAWAMATAIQQMPDR